MEAVLQRNLNRKTKRINWIDMAKGYGILFVIIAHCEVGKLGTWIYTFHLPLFFIISGYLFTYEKDIKDFLKKKFKTIIFPYFALGVPMIVCSGIGHYVKGDYSIIDIIVLVLRFIIQKRMWTLWFLACLFCVEFLFYFLFRYLKSLTKLGLACTFLTLFGYIYYLSGGRSLPWNFDSSWMAITFFYFGFFCKQKSSVFNKFLDKKLSILLFICSLVLNVIFMFINFKLGFRNLEMFGSSYGFLPLVYTSAICGSIAIIIFSKWFTIYPIQYLGMNSMLYFAWHQTIFRPLVDILMSKLGWNITDTTPILEIIGYKVVYVALILILLTACNIVITNTKFRIILGK